MPTTFYRKFFTRLFLAKKKERHESLDNVYYIVMTKYFNRSGQNAIDIGRLLSLRITLPILVNLFVRTIDYCCQVLISLD